MTKTACPVVLLMWAACALGQTIEPQARIVTRAGFNSHVTVVEVATHFVTAIRVPETVNSVVVGDPALFQVEHSEHEPQLVFVKVLTTKPAQTNVLISTTKGHQLSLLVASRGEQARPTVDFVVNYRPEANFVIEPALPSVAISETVALKTLQVEEGTSAGGSPSVLPTAMAFGPLSASVSLGTATLSTPRRGGLDELLEQQQQRAPLPELYSEHPRGESGGGDRVRTGVGEVIDGGQDVIVLFSVVNPQHRNILLMPPQVQLGGKTKQGKLIKQSRWTTAEQLPVMDYRLSRRRLAPGERADGVVVFERPPFKQSNETLFLQMAEAGAVDHPALAPIGFGISTTEENSHGRRSTGQ